MALWQGEPATVPVRWFRAPSGSTIVPQPNQYVSSVWDTVGDSLEPPVGEASPSTRSWNSGANLLGYLGSNYCGDPAAWANGGVYDLDPAHLTNPDGSCSCCNSSVLGSGGVGLGGQSVFPSGLKGGVVWGGSLGNIDSFAGGVAWGGSVGNIDSFAGGVAWGGSLGIVNNFAGGIAWAGLVARHDLFAGGIAWAGVVGGIQIFAGGVAWAGEGAPFDLVAGGVSWGGAVTIGSSFAQVVAGGVSWGGNVSAGVPTVDTYTGGPSWGGEVYSLAGPPVVAAGGVGWGGEVQLALRPFQSFTGGLSSGGALSLSSSYLATVTGGNEWAGQVYEDSMSYPTFCSLFADEATPSGSGYVTYQDDANQAYAYYSWYSSPAIGDSFTWPFFLAGGNYNMFVLAIAGNNRGQVEVYIDGVLQGAIFDFYTPSTEYNYYVGVNVNVIGDGPHTLELKVSGKNGSSSNYFFLITKVTFG